MKKFVAPILGLVAAVAIGLGINATPGETAKAVGCDAYTQTTVTAPYGVSGRLADQINVKVINSTGNACGAATLAIYPRTGTSFHSVVFANGGWSCVAPAVGTDPTVCTADGIAPYSASTVRVRYNRPYINAPVSGTAYATVAEN